MPPPLPRKTALVLSAGGIRGAYQVGVLDGIVDVLGLRGAAGPPLFDTLVGTSIGAINSTYLAARADRPDHAIDGLVEVWTRLDFGESVRLTPLGLWGWPRWRMPGRRVADPSRGSPYVGRSLFDPRPLEALLERVIAWDRLHVNIRRGLVRALVIAAHDVCDGRTTLFAELAPGIRLRPHDYPVRRTRVAAVTAEQVLASCALPFLLPARNIDGRYYMDGALRFSTPISPALRADADRVVVISLLHRPRSMSPEGGLEYPGVAFLLGKVLGALLLDPVLYDLEDLLQTNRIFEVLGEVLEPPALARVGRRLDREAIAPTRPVPTLVFRPSEDLGRITAAFIRDDLRESSVGPLARALIRWCSRSDLGQEADLSSILLLDGRLAARLVDLGRRDAHAAADRIRGFFLGG